MLAKYILLGCLMSACTALKAQNAAVDSNLITQPEFVGGRTALNQFIADKISYTPTAFQNHIQKTVIAGFVVRKTGRVTNLAFEGSLDSTLDKAVLAALWRMPAWRPAIIDGKPVSRYVALPIKFAITATNEGVVSLGDEKEIRAQRAAATPGLYVIDTTIIEYGYPASSQQTANALRKVSYPDSASTDGLFIVTDYYLGGKVRQMGKSLNPTPYVEFEGPCIQFFANGKKKSIINYDDGRQLGEATYYYPSSGIYAIKEYQEYGNVYLKKCVDSAGHIIADNGKGHWIDYDPGMERITMQGDIDNGKPQGKWSGRVNDTLTVNMNYVNGELQKGLSTASSGKSYSFTKESMFPKFKGGIESFYKFLAQNIRMPPSMVKSRVGGKVFISFMVEKDGSLSNFITEKGLLDKAAEKEAIRVIALSSGMWKPALKYGLIPERQEYIVPLNFAFSYR